MSTRIITSYILASICIFLLCIFAFVIWAGKQNNQPVNLTSMKMGRQTAAVSDAINISQDSYGSGGGRIYLGYFWSGVDRWVGGAKFTAKDSYTLTRIVLPMNKVGTPSYMMRAWIYSDNDGVIGSGLGTPSSWISSNQTGDIPFDSMNVSIASGTVYWIVLESDLVNGDGANYQTWTYTFDGGNGPLYSGSDGNNWNLVSNNTHMNFITYSSETPVTPVTVEPIQRISFSATDTPPSTLSNSSPAQPLDMSIYTFPTYSDGLIPNDRQFDWQRNSGLPSSIPDRPICAIVTDITYGAKGDGVADDTQAIQRAINECPSGKAVYLPEGIYKFSRLSMKSDVSLRGAGPAKTTLRGGSINAVGSRWFDESADISSGFSKGSKKVVLTTVPPNLRVGMHVIIDQLNDGTVVDIVGSEGMCGYCSRSSGRRAIGQIVQVISIQGSDISFDPPLAWNYSASLNPQMFYAVEYGSSRNFISNVGLENFKIQGTGYTIVFERAANSWISGVESYAASTAHVRFVSVFRSELRDSYFHDIGGSASSPGQGYGILLEYQSSNNLIQNNAFSNIRGDILIDAGSNGNVIGYNYISNPVFYPNVLGANLIHHSAHPYMNLWEGNVAYKADADNIHGSASHNTFFRNYLKAILNTSYSASWAVVLDRKNTHFNLLGNVLGSPGFSGYYEKENAPSQYSDKIIYRLGYVTEGDGNAAGNDSQVRGTILRHGNYDYQTHSTIWDPNIPNHNLPPSLYLSSKPAWFGPVPFPAIGPDVSGLVNKIPAQLCYEQGKMPNCLLDVNSVPITPQPIPNDNPPTNPPPITPLPPSCITYPTGDFNHDCAVNSLDFSALSAYWNQSSSTYDLTGDNIVNTLDYVVLVKNWTK